MNLQKPTFPTMAAIVVVVIAFGIVRRTVSIEAAIPVAICLALIFRLLLGRAGQLPPRKGPRGRVIGELVLVGVVSAAILLTVGK